MLLHVWQDTHKDTYHCMDSVLIDDEGNRVNELLDEFIWGDFQSLVIEQIDQQDQGITS